MMPSLQAVLHRWWTLLWSDGGAVAKTADVPSPAVAAEALAVAVAPAMPVVVAAEAPLAAPAPRHVEADEDCVALAETVRLAVPEPALIMSPGDAEMAERRAKTLTAIEQLKQIPALQSLARGFLQAAARDDVDLDEVIATIGKDPALCVRVLRMANSAAIRPETTIEDVQQAVQMLGVIRVRTMARALYTLRDSRSIAPGYDWQHLWIHALATATLAEDLQGRLGLPADPGLYLAALLHDVGKIVLSIACPEDYAAVMLTAWNHSRSLDELERTCLGVSHREAGEVYLERSGLPFAVVSTALHHHFPGAAPVEHRQLVALVALANHLAKAYGLGFSGSVAGVEDDLEFGELPAWDILESDSGRTFDRLETEEAIRALIPGLKADLRSLRELGA